MSVQPQVSAVPTSNQNAVSNVARPSAGYHPNLWADLFLPNSTNLTKVDAKSQRKHKKLKEEVRSTLDNPDHETSEKLHLIDSVQRLGLDYYFEKQIEAVLEKIYQDGEVGDNISTVSVRFRLLRQHGFKVLSNVFEIFLDEKGKFKEVLVNDVSGMLNLYESAYCAVHGEDILDEALAFTTYHLRSLKGKVSPHQAEQITYALKFPIRKGVPRLQARQYISIYSKDPSFNKKLLTFAKLDFNMVQAVHQVEITSIKQWWKKLNFKAKVPYARDREVECYFWTNCVYFEPKYARARIFLTKVMCMASILDDTYDLYGTYEELKLFTEIIQWWEVSLKDQLPGYMKPIYQALLDVFSEIEEGLAEERGLFRVQYGIESVQRLVRAYLVEAMWCREGYIPSKDEYMQNGILTSGFPLFETNSLVGMGDIATKEAFKWIYKEPKMVMASSICCRLINDIASHGFEQKTRSHVASCVECCMKQYDVSEEEAVKICRQDVANAWKDINEECMKPTPVPMAVLMRVLNFTRSLEVIYENHQDKYTNSYLLKDCITSLFVDPVPL